MAAAYGKRGKMPFVTILRMVWYFMPICLQTFSCVVPNSFILAFISVQYAATSVFIKGIIKKNDKNIKVYLDKVEILNYFCFMNKSENQLSKKVAVHVFMPMTILEKERFETHIRKNALKKGEWIKRMVLDAVNKAQSKGL